MLLQSFLYEEYGMKKEERNSFYAFCTDKYGNVFTDEDEVTDEVTDEIDSLVEEFQERVPEGLLENTFEY